ncbi:zinc finger CCCH domain-containing protein 3-like isoform X2 [Ptychodera flava]|uniref:zinc finger CCCH domain-containing protein 3-like isoform X2 n=1 Tax=Ptychodera flava TaxID=63121 RepID=UPI003969FFF0
MRCAPNDTMLLYLSMTSFFKMAEDTADKLRDELQYLTALIRNHKNAATSNVYSSYHGRQSYKYTKPMYERSKMSWTRTHNAPKRNANQSNHLQSLNTAQRSAVTTSRQRTEGTTLPMQRTCSVVAPLKQSEAISIGALPSSTTSMKQGGVQEQSQFSLNHTKPQVAITSKGTSQAKHGDTTAAVPKAVTSATYVAPSNSHLSSSLSGNSKYKWTSKDSQANTTSSIKSPNLQVVGEKNKAGPSGISTQHAGGKDFTSRFKLKRSNPVATSKSSATNDGRARNTSHFVDKERSVKDKNKTFPAIDLRSRYRYVRRTSKGKCTSQKDDTQPGLLHVLKSPAVNTRYKYIRKGGINKCVKKTPKSKHTIPQRSQLTLNRMSTSSAWKKSRYKLVRKKGTAKVPQVGWVSRFSLKKGDRMRDNQSISTVRASRYKLVKTTSKKASTLGIQRLVLPSRAKLKVDRRVNKRQYSSCQYVSIGGILYRSSAKKLANATVPVKISDNRAIIKNTRNKLIRAAPNKQQVHHNKISKVIVNVRGQRFTVDPSGKTMRRWTEPMASQADKAPSRLDFGGMTFVQTTPGTLVRKTDYTKILAQRMLQRSIHTTNAMKWKKSKPKQFCMFYNRFGKCNRGDKCQYIHDPEKVAVCTRFLRGTCKDASCPFSHKVSKDKMPVCSFFLRGVCNRDDCPYLHVNVNRSAAVCEDFLKGYCPLGEKCKKRHVLDCPEFAKSGVCADGKKCKMIHRVRRNLKRKSSSDHKEQPEKRNSSENKNHQEPIGTNQMTDNNDHGRKRKRSADFDEEDDDDHSKKLPSFISLVDDDTEETESSTEERPVKESLHIRPRFLKRKTTGTDLQNS